MHLVLICGGRGTRLGALNPLRRPKAMHPVHGRPLAAHLLERFAPLTDTPPVVVHAADDDSAPAWTRTLPTGATLVAQDRPDGVANALALATPHLPGPALLLLGDLVLVGDFEKPLPTAPAVGVWMEGPSDTTRANFGVRLEGGRVVELVEKPSDVTGLVCGIGAYLLTPEHLRIMMRAPLNPTTGEREVTEGLRELLRNGFRMQAMRFTGTYLNVNTPDDLARAEQLLR